MDATTETIVSFASTLKAESLDVSTVNEARRRLVDSLACMVGGVDSAPARIARSLASEVRAVTPAAVAGSPDGSSPEMAAFANTVALRYLDYNDTYFSPLGGGGHPSDLIPTALALGDVTGASGADVIRRNSRGIRGVGPARRDRAHPRAGAGIRDCSRLSPAPSPPRACSASRRTRWPRQYRSR